MGNGMSPSLRERREKTFDLLIVAGYDYSEVVERISAKYNITESGVRSDISRMEKWLPELVEDDAVRKDGLVRLKELRANRQRLNRMAREAAANNDLETELRVRERIDDNLDLDVALSQSLGLTSRRPAEIEQRHVYRVESEVVSVESRVEGPDDVEGAPPAIDNGQ